MKKPTRWSYSSLSTYTSCPFQYKLSYIERLEWPESPAMMRGTRLHKMAEEFLKGTVDRVAPEVQKIGPTLESLKSLGARSEETWLLDQRWEPVDDPNDAWVKAIIDVTYVAGNVLFVKDFKSGQMYENHRDQLELYSLMGLKKHPEVKRAESSAIYIDVGIEGMHGSVIPMMRDKMIQAWDAKATVMMEDKEYKPNPGNQCRWCPFSKSKGGPCQH